MTTDDERREVARRLREIADGCEEVSYFDLARTLGLGAVSRYGYDPDDVRRLADLIEPTNGFDLDTVQRVCFECMEGCDEPEWTLYTTIHDAIARYKRGESGPTYDREALLALAGCVRKMGEGYDKLRAFGLGTTFRAIADRIREALGVES